MGNFPLFNVSLFHALLKLDGVLSVGLQKMVFPPLCLGSIIRPHPSDFPFGLPLDGLRSFSSMLSLTIKIKIKFQWIKSMNV